MEVNYFANICKIYLIIFESQSVEFKCFDKPVSIPRFGSFSVNHQKHYQAEIEILQYCIGAQSFFKDFILEWLALENMYGDFTCHFLTDYNVTKASQFWFYKELRTSDLPEPLPLNGNRDLIFTQEEIRDFLGQCDLCTLGCREVHTKIDPYRDWIKYNKNEIYYYEKKQPPRPFTEIEQAIENLVNQPRDPKIKQLSLYSNLLNSKNYEVIK